MSDGRCDEPLLYFFSIERSNFESLLIFLYSNLFTLTLYHNYVNLHISHPYFLFIIQFNYQTFIPILFTILINFTWKLELILFSSIA